MQIIIYNYIYVLQALSNSNFIQWVSPYKLSCKTHTINDKYKTQTGPLCTCLYILLFVLSLREHVLTGSLCLPVRVDGTKTTLSNASHSRVILLIQTATDYAAQFYNYLLAGAS